MQKIIEATNFDRDKILRLAYAQNDAYRSFKLPKKCGTGTRDIKIPGPSLMSLQRSILQNILSNYEVSENAHAYVSGRSIISHASKHVGATCFIHMDLRNCFENILTKTIFELFKNRNWEKSEAALLARLTTNDGSLPQGAPTSPYLCNLALFQLDKMLAEFSTGKGYVFSRYGDDIVISGSDIQENEFFEAISIVHTNGYSINQSKTRLARKSKRTIITGISISNGSLKLPKEKKRKIRQQVYFIRKNGVLAESFSDDVFDPFYADRVLGKIVFWHNVEPENTFAKKAFNDLKALMNEHKTKYF